MISEALAQYESLDNLDEIIDGLTREMNKASKKLEFERAAHIRDQIKALKKKILFEF